MSLNAALWNVNFLAVLVAGFVHMALGLMWHRPAFFGKQWVELTKREMKPARRWIPAGVIGHQLIALLVAVVVCLANATTVVDGAAVALLIWIGSIVPLEIGEVIWEKIPVRLAAIRIGYHAAALSTAGIILAAWR